MGMGSPEIHWNEVPMMCFCHEEVCAEDEGDEERLVQLGCRVVDGRGGVAVVVVAEAGAEDDVHVELRVGAGAARVLGQDRAAAPGDGQQRLCVRNDPASCDGVGDMQIETHEKHCAQIRATGTLHTAKAGGGERSKQTILDKNYTADTNVPGMGERQNINLETVRGVHVGWRATTNKETSSKNN